MVHSVRVCNPVPARPSILLDDVRGALFDQIDSSLSLGQAADVALAKFAGRATIKQVVVAALDLLREGDE